MANKYIGLHPNDLNRTKYGEIVLYIEGEPAAFFSSSGDFIISGSLAIGGIANVSASISAAANAAVIDTGSFMLTGSVSGDTITFTKGDGTTFQTTITNVVSASYAFTSSYVFLAVSASYATTASYTTLAVSASSVKLSNATSDNEIKYIGFTEKVSGYDDISISTNLRFLPLTSTLSTNNFLGDLQGTASYALTASYVPAVAFDGNRPITQVLIPDLVNYNPGTSTVSDFLEQVFYPEVGFGIEIFSNDPFSIMEHARSGSYIWANTVGYDNFNPDPIAKFTANVPVSWSLQANNLLAIHPTSGSLTLKTNISGSTVYTAPSTVQGTVVATAVAGGFRTRDFTVNIIPQTEPQIQTGYFYPTVNNVFVTASGAQLGLLDVVDTTNIPYGTSSLIGSGGLDIDKFSITEYSSYFGTNSLRYRVDTTQALNSGSYLFHVTASNGYGTTYSEEITITVEENTPPIISIVNSPYTRFLADATSGSAFGSLTISDFQQGSIPPGTPKYGKGYSGTYVDRIVSASLSGTDASKFELRALVSSSTPPNFNYPHTITYGVYFREAGTAGTYNITASGFDQFGHTTVQPIANEVQVPRPAYPYQNGNFYIIESAVTGDSVTTEGSGIAGTAAIFTTDQPVSWSLQDNPTGLLAISGSTVAYVTLKGNVSGSAYQNGSFLTGTVIATNEFGLSNTTPAPFTVTVTNNVLANITADAVSQNNYYTVSGRRAGFGTVTVSDPQSYENVELISIGGPGGSFFVTSSESPAQSVTYTLSSSADLNSGSYAILFTARDGYGQITLNTYTFTVTPNNPPTVTPASFSKDISLATLGATIGQVTVSDGDSLEGLASVVLGGTDASKFDLVELSGTTTKIYALNTTEALTGGTYSISVTATDNFGHVTVQDITVSITVNAPSIPTPNGTFRIIESAVSGSSVTTATSGIAGTKAKFTTDQSVTWSLQSGAVLAISQSGELSIKIPMSGSAVYSPGSIIADRVIATNQFSAAEQFDFQVEVTDDLSPTITSTLASKNNNKTTTSTGFGTITISDPQSLGNVSLTDFNGPNVGSFTFTPGAAGSTRTYAVSSSGALNSGSYNFSVTGSDAYNQKASGSFTITVEENLPPTITYTGFSKTVAQSTNGAEVGTVLVADPQDDSIVSFTLSGPDASKFSATLDSSTATTSTYKVTTTQDLSTGTYAITGSGTDSFGLTTIAPKTVTVSPSIPDVPSKSGNFYIIESAVSGALVTTATSGIAGSQAQMTTDQSVSWSLSPGIYLYIDPNGYLSTKANISGSIKTAGSLVSATIRATNAYDEYSERLVDVDVTANAAPVLSYTGLTVNSGSASANGQTVGTVTATDPQSLDSISSIAITGGTDAAKFALALSGSTSYTKTYNINAAQDLTGGSYQIQLTATDSFNKQTVDTKTITVTSTTTAKVYVYSVKSDGDELNGQGQDTEANALEYYLGKDTSGGTYYTGGTLDRIINSGALGDSQIDNDFDGDNYGRAILLATGSLGSLNQLGSLGQLDFSDTVGKMVMLVYPNVAALDGKPIAMYDTGINGNLSNIPNSQSVIVYAENNDWKVIPAGLEAITLGSAVDGVTSFTVLYTHFLITANSKLYVLDNQDTLPSF